MVDGEDTVPRRYARCLNKPVGVNQDTGSHYGGPKAQPEGRMCGNVTAMPR